MWELCLRRAIHTVRIPHLAVKCRTSLAWLKAALYMQPATDWNYSIDSWMIREQPLYICSLKYVYLLRNLNAKIYAWLHFESVRFAAVNKFFKDTYRWILIFREKIVKLIRKKLCYLSNNIWYTIFYSAYFKIFLTINLFVITKSAGAKQIYVQLVNNTI